MPGASASVPQTADFKSALDQALPSQSPVAKTGSAPSGNNEKQKLGKKSEDESGKQPQQKLQKDAAGQALATVTAQPVLIVPNAQSGTIDSTGSTVAPKIERTSVDLGSKTSLDKSISGSKQTVPDKAKSECFQKTEPAITADHLQPKNQPSQTTSNLPNPAADLNGDKFASSGPEKADKKATGEITQQIQRSVESQENIAIPAQLATPETATPSNEAASTGADPKKVVTNSAQMPTVAEKPAAKVQSQAQPHSPMSRSAKSSDGNSDSRFGNVATNTSQDGSSKQNDNTGNGHSLPNSTTQPAPKSEIKRSEANGADHVPTFSELRDVTLRQDQAKNAGGTAKQHADIQGPNAAITNDNAQLAHFVNSAKLAQTVNGSEMRVGLHSAEFGAIAIHTNLDRGHLSADISIEHTSLSRTVSDQIPALQAKLRDEQGINTQINIQDRSASYSGNSEERQSREHQQNTSPAASSGFQTPRSISTRLAEPGTVTLGDSGRLSIRI